MQDDAAFRRWYADMARRHGLNADPDADGQLYDYRAAFKAGAKPDESGHWPSDFKKPGHPAMVVGGFHVQTGERVPGTPRASEAELVRLGWDAATAKRLSAMTEQDGRAMQKRIELGGKVYEFPSDATDAEIAAALDAAAPSPKAERSGIADAAIGAAKGLGRAAVGTGRAMFAGYNPGSLTRIMSEPDPDALQPENDTQRVAGLVGEYGPTALSAGAAARGGSNLIRRAATHQWQRAAGRPVLEHPAIANKVLESGRGGLSRGNAQAFAQSRQHGGPPVTRTLNTQAEKSLVEGVEHAERRPAIDSQTSIVGLLASLGKPYPRSVLAQMLHSSAPAINATAGAGGATAMQWALRNLFGEQEK
jgi:hypothetical protein